MELLIPDRSFANGELKMTSTALIDQKIGTEDCFHSTILLKSSPVRHNRYRHDSLGQSFCVNRDCACNVGHYPLGYLLR